MIDYHGSGNTLIDSENIPIEFKQTPIEATFAESKVLTKLQEKKANLRCYIHFRFAFYYLKVCLGFFYFSS